MKKVTLTFPTYDALWLFKDKSNGINIRIEPRKKAITGLFRDPAIDMALSEFQAVHDTTVSPVHPPEQYAIKTSAVPRFSLRSTVSQLMSAFNF